jgi:hypothetical protein
LQAEGENRTPCLEKAQRGPARRGVETLIGEMREEITVGRLGGIAE